MPTYEYACRDCGEHLEVVQSFRDDALEVCPNCDGELRKVFSAAGIIFKGSGWHSKDYASSGPPPSSAPSEDSAGDGAAADTASGTETSGTETTETQAAETPTEKSA